MISKLTAVAISLAVCVSGATGGGNPRTIVASPRTSEVVLDGVLAEPAWQGAADRDGTDGRARSVR